MDNMVLYHYRCDAEDDRGWGCLYRCYQMLYTAATGCPAPSVSSMMRTLGISRSLHFRSMWIEPIDARTMATKHGLQVDGRLMLYVDKPERLLDPFALDAMRRTPVAEADRVFFSTDKLLRDLRRDFESGGRLPIIIDDTICAYCIVGFGDHDSYLKVADPHTVDSSRVLRTMSREAFDDRKIWMVYQAVRRGL